MISQLDYENADRDLTSQVTVLTDTPDASNPLLCQLLVFLGDGSKNLNANGGVFELEVIVGGNSVQPGPQNFPVGDSDTRVCFISAVFPVPANTQVIAKVKSPNAGDTDVDVSAYLYDVSVTPANFGSLGIESDGDLTKVDSLDGHTAQTGDSYPIVTDSTYGLSAIRTRGDSAWTSYEGVGTGDTEVTSDTGGSGALEVQDEDGAGISQALVRAYLKSEYDAGVFTVRASALTDDDGVWGPIYLDSGSTYTLTFTKSGYDVQTTEVSVT